MELREALEAYIANQRATKIHGAGDYYSGSIEELEV